MPTRFPLPALLLALAFVFAAAAACAQPRQAEGDPLLQRAHAALAEATAPGRHAGAVLLVARAGGVIDWRASGHRDAARTRPLRRDDIFRIQSMTKPIASVAAMILVEDGRLRLDAPVADYLPAFADIRVVDGGSADAPRLRPPSRPPTIRDLLAHIAGFPAGLDGDDVAAELQRRADPHAAADLAAFAARVAAAPLAADPGTRFGYDGVATEVLSRVVEVASGERFADFVSTRILEPLRMRDTGFEVPEAQRARIAEVTTTDADGRVVAAGDDAAPPPGARMRPWDSGAGGLYSTAADYARFARMLLGGGTLDGVTLLRPDTVERMLRDQLADLDPARARPGTGEGFGLGFGIVVDPARRGGAVPAGVAGWTGAMSTAFSVDRERDLAIVWMQQFLPGEASNGPAKPWRRVQSEVYEAMAR